MKIRILNKTIRIKSYSPLFKLIWFLRIFIPAGLMAFGLLSFLWLLG